ncbi:DUF1254 domain-containing protein [Phycicoccus sp. M110.8]|uniref:DUF1254 domain-containing protein n=1 Tax=Phycicoccus sp. M110.8 TaxID=3075433 RepID=UPI0028FD922B|nr:DUF1254 domain-containing protein [Phycicoccus sp. M110.8]MDU0314152.1 DUF1254 domain-containing protein [Phycicoccus sp. M110.8]
MSVRQETRPTSTTFDDAGAIAVEAYVYLFPLVLMEVTRRQMTSGPVGAKVGFAPMGTFSHAREFPPGDFRGVVRPNFDTLYSSAWLDVSTEPSIVSVPDTQGRYYLLPMYDMWTEAFAVPGTRTTGTAAASYAVVPPGWRGELPAGVTAVQAPTPHIWVIGRIQTNGPADYENVRTIQGGFTITPLSGWDGAGGSPAPVQSGPATAPSDPDVDTETPPLDQVLAMPSRQFFTLAEELRARHGSHLTDWSILARMRRLGLAARDLDFDALEPEAREALDRAPAAALALMHASVPRMARVLNGWQLSTDTMGVYGNSYLKRAIVALTGLGANQVEDAIYPLNMTDARGEQLDGDRNYVLHFEAGELPPVAAFWSVTMYDTEGFQVPNALNRFAIGDRDPLVYNPDGSLDLYLQHSSPGPEREANWLPAPRGPLGVTMRLYAPAPEALDGRWTPPPIRRAT